MAGERRTREISLEAALDERLVLYAGRWKVSASAVVSLALSEFLADRDSRRDGRPLRVRLPGRRGPLSARERRASARALRALRQRGGRPLGARGETLR